MNRATVFAFALALSPALAAQATEQPPQNRSAEQLWRMQLSGISG